MSRSGALRHSTEMLTLGLAMQVPAALALGSGVEESAPEAQISTPHLPSATAVHVLIQDRAPAGPAPQRFVTAGAGTFDIRIEAHAWRALDAELPVGARLWQSTLLKSDGVSIEMDGLKLPTFRRIDAALAISPFAYLGERAPSALRLVAGTDGAFLALVDAAGAIWATLRSPMLSPDPDRDGLLITTMDVVVGPALHRVAPVAAVGDFLGEARLRWPLERSAFDPADAMAKSCAAPVWPGVADKQADVTLLDIPNIRVPTGACFADDGACDGPGGTAERFVVAPDAHLKNDASASAADVPWYRQFSPPAPPYGNDQHPYLYWNVYREHADGTFDQIGTSALKHAFNTQNVACQDASCSSRFNILGRACEDVYALASNDNSVFLAPRREIVAATGQWARCGSLFDPDCNGADDSGQRSYDPSLRLTLDDAAVGGASANASFYAEAAYIVRDDVNPFNTGGYRPFVAAWTGLPPRWQTVATGPFTQGDFVADWFARAAARSDTIASRFSSHASADGMAMLATIVTVLPNGRFRYRLTLANRSLANAQLDGTEPNLRLVKNEGLVAVAIPSLGTTALGGIEFRDGSATTVDDWSFSPTPDVQWLAPAGPGLSFGRAVSFEFESRGAPVATSLTATLGGDSAPPDVIFEVLAPDGALIFGDGLE